MLFVYCIAIPHYADSTVLSIMSTESFQAIQPGTVQITPFASFFPLIQSGPISLHSITQCTVWRLPAQSRPYLTLYML